MPCINVFAYFILVLYIKFLSFQIHYYIHNFYILTICMFHKIRARKIVTSPFLDFVRRKWYKSINLFFFLLVQSRKRTRLLDMKLLITSCFSSTGVSKGFVARKYINKGITMATEWIWLIMVQHPISLIPPINL